jgi:two-component system, response regulator
MRANDMTILLVENDPDDAILTIRALRDGLLSNPIEIISTADSAMAYLRNPANPLPTLVMLDLKLNGKDGLWVLMQIRAHRELALLPVLVFTSSNQQEDMIRSYDSGASAYVRKPVTAETLLTAAPQLGLFWRLTPAKPPEGLF